MDHVLYRNTPIMVKTIPKGTLLFRLTKSAKDDIRGYPKKDGTRCILSNHNVFFYPNPFVGRLALSEFIRAKQYPYITVYVLKNDVKVVWLLKPSKYARTHKNKKKTFLKRCSTIRKGCLDRISLQGSHAPYNPCFSDGFIEKHPDIVGMMAIAFGDMKRINDAMSKSSTPGKSFFKFATDSNENTSIPELVLHPLKRRPSKDIVVQQGDTLETNYKMLTQIDSSDESKLTRFMKNHAVFNPETYFYTYKE